MPGKVLGGLTGCENMSSHSHHVHIIKMCFSQEQVQYKMETGLLDKYRQWWTKFNAFLCGQVLMLLDYIQPVKT